MESIKKIVAASSVLLVVIMSLHTTMSVHAVRNKSTKKRGKKVFMTRAVSNEGAEAQAQVDFLGQVSGGGAEEMVAQSQPVASMVDVSVDVDGQVQAAATTEDLQAVATAQDAQMNVAGLQVASNAQATSSVQVATGADAQVVVDNQQMASVEDIQANVVVAQVATGADAYVVADGQQVSVDNQVASVDSQVASVDSQELARAQVTGLDGQQANADNQQVVGIDDQKASVDSQQVASVDSNQVASAPISAGECQVIGAGEASTVSECSAVASNESNEQEDEQLEGQGGSSKGRGARAKRYKIIKAEVPTLEKRLWALHNNPGIDARMRSFRIIAQELDTKGAQYTEQLKQSAHVLSGFVSVLQSVIENPAMLPRQKEKANLEQLLTRLTHIQNQALAENEATAVAQRLQAQARQEKEVRAFDAVEQVAKQQKQLAEFSEEVGKIKAEKEQLVRKIKRHADKYQDLLISHEAEVATMAQGAKAELAAAKSEAQAALTAVKNEALNKHAQADQEIDALKATVLKAELLNKEMAIAIEEQARRQEQTCSTNLNEQKNACKVQLVELQNKLEVQKKDAHKIAQQESAEVKKQERMQAALQIAQIQGTLLAVRDERDRLRSERDSIEQVSKLKVAELQEKIVALNAQKDKIFAEKELLAQAQGYVEYADMTLQSDSQEQAQAQTKQSPKAKSRTQSALQAQAKSKPQTQTQAKSLSKVKPQAHAKSKSSKRVKKAQPMQVARG